MFSIANVFAKLKIKTYSKFSPIRIISHAATAESVAVNSADEDAELLNAKPYKDIPTIPALPFLGTSWTVMPIIGKYDFRKLHKASELKLKEYGKIIREDITTYNSFVHIFDPKDYEKVFRSEGRNPERRPLESFLQVVQKKKDVFPNPGLLNTNGEEWYELRSKVQGHMLKPKTTVNFLRAMDEVASDFVERMRTLRDPKSLEISSYIDELYRWALENIGLVALDTRLGCFSPNLTEDSETMKMIRGATSIFNMLYSLEFKAPYWKLFPTPMFRKFSATIDHFTEVSQKYLRQAKQRLERNKDPDKELTFLELLLMEDMDPRHIAILINDMLLAGIDSTSNTSGFFMYHMAKHPKEQEKLFQEIKTLLPQRDSPITKEVLNDAKYLKACVKESIRLLPVAPLLIRRLIKDTVLSGYRIPKGTQMIMHLMVASQMEENFKDALKFNPDRFLRNSDENKKISSFGYIPFGFGPRACIGRRIAEQELYTLILRIFRNFKIEYHYGDIDMYTRMVSVPDKPLRFQFHERGQ